jgi:phosphatidylglycerophosphate synthase
MAYWDAYWKSLKPLEVEEPIDVFVHRPLAYVLARAAEPTPITPNLITLGSIALGVSAGVLMLQSFPGHLALAGAAIFLSAVFDCADGQLARMRGTSSALGRMLDGCADLVVSAVVVGGGAYLIWSEYARTPWQGALVLALVAVTIFTGSLHTSMYDHYKNLFLRLTHSTYREGEDYESALARYEQSRSSDPFWMRAAWRIYLFYVKGQFDYIRKFDPNTWLSLREIPAYDERRAEVYRRHQGELMRLWRSFFGFGSLVFGMSVSVALSVVEYYMLFRLLLLNALFYGYVRPRQRAASRAVREELAALAAGTA